MYDSAVDEDFCFILTKIESFAYAYDMDDQIISCTHVNSLPAEGKKRNETRDYVYDRYGRLTQSTKTNHLSSDAQSVTSYGYDAVGNRICGKEGSTTRRYFHDEGSALSATYTCIDFGETEEITSGSLDNEICYTGAVYDDESRLYYMNARYYNSVNGRFISQDNYSG